MNKLHVKIVPKIPKTVPLTKNQIDNIVEKSLSLIIPNLTNELEIEILFVGEKEIRSLNRDHRGIDEPTNVLSFPQEQFKTGTRSILGSIVIYPEKVIEKKEDFSNVIKHGLLHLLGYDHETGEKSWDDAAVKINCRL